MKKVPSGYLTAFTDNVVPRDGILKAEGKIKVRFLMWNFYVFEGLIHGYTTLERAKWSHRNFREKCFIFKATILAGVEYAIGFGQRIAAKEIHIDFQSILTSDVVTSDVVT